MSERAVELLSLPDEVPLDAPPVLTRAQGSFYILDVGCGSGLSGTVLTEVCLVTCRQRLYLNFPPARTHLGRRRYQSLHDPCVLLHSRRDVQAIHSAHAGVAHERETEGDLIVRDMGHGMPFRPATFDAAIRCAPTLTHTLRSNRPRSQRRCRSVSALQWLCNADKKDHNPKHRLNVFFQSLYNCLVRGARAVLQFYPADGAQLAMISDSAMRCVSRRYCTSLCPRSYVCVSGAASPAVPSSISPTLPRRRSACIARQYGTHRSLGISSCCLQAAPERLRRCPRLSVCRAHICRS